jgi:DNA-binding NarL/FixJ family response regulator
VISTSIASDHRTRVLAVDGGHDSDDAVPPVRTLLVDDAADIRRLLAFAAEDRDDLEVVGTAADGAEAIEAAGRLKPDLVVLDIEMPVLDGISALPRVREVAPGASIVILSAFDRGTYERLARDRGAVGYVEKGLAPAVILDEVMAAAGLLQVVRKVLDESRRQLSGDTESGREARRMVSEALQRWDDRVPGDDVELLVTELVTNAVLHGGSAPEVALLLLPDAIRVEVADGSSEMPQLRAATLEDTSGRGIALVDELASRWGAEPGADGGKTVWFEIDRRI